MRQIVYQLAVSQNLVLLSHRKHSRLPVFYVYFTLKYDENQGNSDYNFITRIISFIDF